MTGEVFEASEELATEFGSDPNDMENVVSTEEFHAPRNVLTEGEWYSGFSSDSVFIPAHPAHRRLPRWKPTRRV